MNPSSIVLVTGHCPWGASTQTPHYVANFFSRRRRVLYVEPGIAWNRSSPAFSWKRILYLIRHSLRWVESNVWTFTPQTMPLGRFRFAANLNTALFAAGLRVAMTGLGAHNCLLWLAETHNSIAVRDLFPQAPAVFHALDYFVRQSDADAARRLAATSDLVLASSPLIADSLRASSKHIEVFPNGWEFDPTALADNSIAPDLNAIPLPRVGLVATLTRDLDYQLLQRLVDTVPLSLVLIGSLVGAFDRDDQRALRTLQSRNRVYSLGPRPLSALPAYIRGLSVCVAPYKRDLRNCARDPLKVYQYLAFGRPVVSTPVAALNPARHLVRLADTPEEFISAVESELTGAIDRQRESECRAFAERARWENRWKDLAASFPKAPRLADFRELLDALTNQDESVTLYPSAHTRPEDGRRPSGVSKEKPQ